MDSRLPMKQDAETPDPLITTAYYIWGTFRGAARYPFWAQDREPGRALYVSTAHFCPHCGLIWAKREFRIDNQPSPDGWRVETTPCPHHGKPTLLSSIMWEWEELHRYLPVEILRAELVNYQTERRKV